MPIDWWLWPIKDGGDFFGKDILDINVILVALMINWTLYAIVSNFLEDFHVPNRAQAANYFGVTLMTVAFFILTAALEPVKTLYPNPYDWLLIGNGPALGCIVFGLIGGVVLGYFLGNNRKLLIGSAMAAVISEGLIGLFTMLWILSQE